MVGGRKNAHKTVDRAVNLWKRHVMALEDVTERLERIRGALEEASVPLVLRYEPDD